MHQAKCERRLVVEGRNERRRKKERKEGKDEEVLRKFPFSILYCGCEQPFYLSRYYWELGEERCRELLCLLLMKGQ